ncbi:MAG: Rpn family recombination-promoting nuclease/putative transposase, partial [Planctomycetia bacterium]|nr:Rpn family recombination-promoting nuclease/putative transposase [Planctomycetia bacterium]
MGDKDLTERKLLGRNDVFADVFNAIVFKGRQVIKPDDLKDMDPKSQYRDSEGKKREFQRDVVKYWMSGASYLAICDLEPQTKKNRDMVLRLFAYDGVLYHDQITLFPDSTRVPVITLVVYFEKEPWNKYLRLSDVVQFPPDSKELLLPYFNDFKINVIDVPRLTREQIALFQSDLRICAAFLHNVVNPHDVIPITDPTFDDYQSVCDFLNSICKGSGFKIDNEVFSQLPLEEQNMNSIMQMFFDQL